MYEITGLEKSDVSRMHFDVYAIVEGAQELYFGHEVQVNVNLVETVRVPVDGKVEGGTKSTEKCYLSPTKRRGVERRSLIWAPTADGQLLGDKLECGVPKTCAKQKCPICSVFGGLQTTKPQKTLVGRLVHGGGVAVQRLPPEEKQRAMHPSKIYKETEDNPSPFKRQYDQPGLLFPVYNHCMSITDQEFQAVAYAFLDALARIGAGNPKGVRIDTGLREGEPFLVVDRYLTPKGQRPVVSPSICEAEKARQSFRESAFQVYGESDRNESMIEVENFTRRSGQEALRFLQEQADGFVNRVLNAKA